MPEPVTDVRVQLVGRDGNAFYIIGAVKQALQRAGHRELAERYQEEATAGDYDQLLQTTIRYVHID